MTNRKMRVIVVGAGIGGLTTALLLSQSGYDVTVFEAQSYPGGSASTFYHKGFRFESGATIAGGFQPNGPHHTLAQLTGIKWNVKQHDPAWVVHLPDRPITLTQDFADIYQQFPAAAGFWKQQAAIADLAWKLSASGLPWFPTDLHEFADLLKTGFRYFPADLKLLPFAFMTVKQWAAMHRMTADKAFMRFIDATLLISAQATSHDVNALYGATAMDLARQGVYHVEGGIGGIADTLVQAIRQAGAVVAFKHPVSRIKIESGKAVGVYTTQGRRGSREEFHPADYVVVNNTPWSLDKMLGEDSPRNLRREVEHRPATQGAFVLHLGLENGIMPHDIPDHHQIIKTLDGPMGEGETLYVSMSPEWDQSRAPSGQRAVTVSTHTSVDRWWELLKRDEQAYYAEKQAYSDRIIETIDRVIPGFKRSIVLNLPGTPVTYAFYTLRERGMVGGFPQKSLFSVRTPLTGIPNIRLVGDSIFPGQSTAGVTLGGIRVARGIMRQLAPVLDRSGIPTIAKDRS
jgi:C-3',4' desaturase CrtD